MNTDRSEIDSALVLWQSARREYFDLLDMAIAGEPMNWERITSTIDTMDRVIHNMTIADQQHQPRQSPSKDECRAVRKAAAGSGGNLVSNGNTG